MIGTTKFNLESILKMGLDYSPDCFGVLDENQVVVYCNNTFADAFGVTKQDALGLNHIDLLKAAWSEKKGVNIECEDFSDWASKLEALYDEKSLNQFEADFRDGRWFKMTRMNLENGYIFMFGVDITALKEAQKDLEDANQKIQILANTDQLTGLFNRRAFHSLSDEAITQAKRDKKGFSLLLIDFDLFKEINDQYGHDTGDKVLREFSTISKVFFGQYKALCRIGGEEFVVLASELDLDQAHSLAEKFRVLVAGHQFYLENIHQHIQVTVSIGVAHWRADDLCINGSLQRADDALYKAKRAGRNKVFKAC